jgi:hypothetical protein
MKKEHKKISPIFFVTVPAHMLFLRFKDNFPGKDFVNGFLARHKELTVRTASLIKRDSTKRFFFPFSPLK